MDFVNKRQSVDGVWDDYYNVRDHQRRVPWTFFSSRIRNSWVGAVWYRHFPKSGQKWENVKTAIKNWAHDNGLTLAFITIMFIVTWIWILVAVTFFGGKLH